MASASDMNSRQASIEKEEKFEDALTRLERILRILEKGDLGLEESIGYFREGSVLYRLCQEKLKIAEGEIKILMEDLKGNITKKPFEGNNNQG